VVATRRAAERASERKVRDMMYGSRALIALQKSVTKVQQNRIEQLPEEHWSQTFSCQNGPGYA
jgi:hypothetical protein